MLKLSIRKGRLNFFHSRKMLADLTEGLVKGERSRNTLVATLGGQKENLLPALRSLSTFLNGSSSETTGQSGAGRSRPGKLRELAVSLGLRLQPVRELGLLPRSTRAPSPLVLLG